MFIGVFVDVIGLRMRLSKVVNDPEDAIVWVFESRRELPAPVTMPAHHVRLVYRQPPFDLHINKIELNSVYE